MNLDRRSPALFGHLRNLRNLLYTFSAPLLQGQFWSVSFPPHLRFLFPPPLDRRRALGARRTRRRPRALGARRTRWRPRGGLALGARRTRRRPEDTVTATSYIACTHGCFTRIIIRHLHSSRNNFARAAHWALATAYILYIPETTTPITA